jgi:isoleucyl-tRNA synthetase
MPFAQVHFPFEREQWFEHHFPADFIVEYIGQTRGWFYTLHVLGTALFDKPPFKDAVAHGIVLGSDGQKMSKSLRNYPDPYDVFETHGSDAMRWFMLSSPLMRGQNLLVKEEAIADVRRLVLNPIWSAWRFFTLYANTTAYEPRLSTRSEHVLDRYVLSKLGETTQAVTASLDAYDFPGACASLSAFVDALTNWYIRRSRDRFWEEEPAAFDTLFTVLHVFCRIAAPLLPFLSEHIYKALTGERSVHLCDWPEQGELVHDGELVWRMDVVRDVCSTAAAIRRAHNLRQRLPLARLRVAVPERERIEPLADLIADEVNVKHVEFVESVGELAEDEVELDRRVAGPRLGGAMPAVLAALREGDVETLAGERLRIAGQELEPGEYRRRLRPREEDSARLLDSGEGVVELDTALTPQLQAEGLARDVIRLVQTARKDADLAVSDRIKLEIEAPAEVAAAIESHLASLTRETLARSVDLTPVEAERPAYRLPDGRTVHIGVSVA